MYLVYLGADPNKRNMEDLRPLHCAVQTGDSAMIRCLLTCGASVDPESKQGTPLHIASLSGNDAAVQILLENQANVHNKKDGYTPLAFAILAPSISCVKRLVQAGADIRDTDDLPPMIWFSNNGLSNCIKRLLEAKADLEILSDVRRHYPARTNNDSLSSLLGCMSQESSVCNWMLWTVLLYLRSSFGEPSKEPPDWCAKGDLHTGN